MFILNDINIEDDEILESHPICLQNRCSKEISCMGMLVKRRLEAQQIRFGDVYYYQFVYFYGKSPVNFLKSDYEDLQRQASFDMDLEMIADFRYAFSEYSSSPGLSSSIKNKYVLSNELGNAIMQVNRNY
ncbi:hypothetical protein [Bacillus paramycoides]|uniref:hypothetical protein n=1 Tax=Bacillus paramycoides TaxID=2026194 RepID=UPI002E23EB97|nr:hypothetical protein [Bacillus paramycoides]